MKIHLPTIIMAMLICTSCGNPLDILGPRDKPDFRNKDMTAITITYWVNTTTNNKLERAFTVTNPAAIEGIMTNLDIKNISGLSIGTGNQLRFHEQIGDSWHGGVVFENRINLSSTADRWRSYTIDLNGNGLFDTMLELCVQHEHTFHPDATKEHIILRSNLRKDYPLVNE